MDLNNLFPPQPVELPSKGKLYPKSNPLSSGVVNMRVMTAKEEDILTNVNFLKKGVAIDKVIQSLVVEKFDYDSLLICDKNTLFFAARIFAYGKEYEITYTDEDGNKIEGSVDLTTMKDKEVDESLFNENNEFNFQLPLTNVNVTFKLLTHRDRKLIDAEIEGLQKATGGSTGGVTTLLKRQITSVDGERDQSKINSFVMNMPTRDVKAFQKYVNDVTPGLVFKGDFKSKDGSVIIPQIDINLTPEFFFPGSGL